MAKTPKKFRGVAEKTVLSKYHVTGGILSGFTVVERATKEPVGEPFENMWDAIKKRDELNA